MVAPQGYESEEVEILKTPKERRSITEPTAKEPTTWEAFAETIATARTVPVEIALEGMPSSKVDFSVNPTIEVSSAETVAVGVTSPMETTHAMTISTGVTTADTSDLSSNDRKNLATNFSYNVSSFFNSKIFSQKP